MKAHERRTSATRAVHIGLLALGLWSALAGCAAEGHSPLGGTWTAIAAPGVEIESNPGTPSLQFTVGGRVNVVTNCTEFSAPVTVVGATIAIGEFAIRTTTTCTAQEREVENAMLAVLRQAREFSGGLPGDRLRIRSAGGELVFAQPRPGFSFETE
jgi:heat shock protein HslJ